MPMQVDYKKLKIMSIKAKDYFSNITRMGYTISGEGLKGGQDIPTDQTSSVTPEFLITLHVDKARICILKYVIYIFIFRSF